jgi:hypothetical protein
MSHRGSLNSLVLARSRSIGKLHTCNRNTVTVEGTMGMDRFHGLTAHKGAGWDDASLRRRHSKDVETKNIHGGQQHESHPNGERIWIQGLVS